MVRQAPPDDEILALRMDRSAPDLWPMLAEIYADHPGYDRFLTDLDICLRRNWDARPADLKRLDLIRDLSPDWFQRPRMAGYAFYVDRFAGSLAAVHDRLDYLVDLGITYVHLMPCLKPRPGDSDGGYSVMDYRAIDPALGTMADFEALATALRARGISLCIDLVLNHTAREHAWAVAARAGDPDYADHYLMFPDRTLPDAYEATLVEVFPDNAPGNFTHDPDTGRWVWTTFNAHQWDLNWANPRVFLDIVDTMLFLANRGVDVLRLDAVAFLWKRIGTRCQSEPEVHVILRALRACCRIAAPAVLHLEEAIVSPSEMLPYLGRGRHDGREGNLAYHNSLMVQFWGALATRNVGLATHVLATHFPTTLTNATYATYLRCHDDIGWAITDEDATAVGWSGPAHRAYLSAFYRGDFPGSFATGAPFQENEATGDVRISGTCASLAGLERALRNDDAAGIDRAIQRILMGHALIAGFGGIPLVWMGDELAMQNDHGYTTNPDHAHDSRWLHRPRMDWDAASTVRTADTPAARVWRGLRHILSRRAATEGLHGAVPTKVLASPAQGVFCVARRAPTGTVMVICNFADDWRHLPEGWLRAQDCTSMHDALSDARVTILDGSVALPPQARVWLT